MELVSLVIAIVGGALGIVAALYKFLVWLREASKQVALPALEHDHVSQLLRLQHRELSVWRVLDLPRDIHMDDVHVEEMLEVPNPIGRTKMPSEARLADEVLKDVAAPRRDTDSRLYVVHGHAGTGKTTMLRHWALSLIDDLESFKAPAAGSVPIPVFLSLRFLSNSKQGAGVRGAFDFDSKILGDCLRRSIPGLPTDISLLPFTHAARLDQSDKLPRALRFLGWVAKLGEMRLFSRPLKPVTQWIHARQARPIQWLFLCDGLDELERDLIGQFMHWARGLPPLTAAVVSMRPEVLPQANAPRSREFRMCNFNESQVETFINQWFEELDLTATSLLQQIHRNDSLHQLSVVPLLLTFLCIDVEVRGDADFPSDVTQSEILRRIVRILLEEWDASKLHRAVDESLIALGTCVLSRLALSTPFGQRTEYRSLLEISTGCADELELDRAHAKELVEQVVSSGHLLSGSPKIGYYFSHKIFFDYFFALAVVEMGSRFSAPRKEKHDDSSGA